MPVNPEIPAARDPGARVAERLAAVERDLREIRSVLQGGAVAQVPVVPVLPAAGRQGRVVMLATDTNLYKDTGSAWVIV